MMDESALPLQAQAAQARQAVQAALLNLDQLTQAAHDLEATLQARLAAAERFADLAQFDPALLGAFFAHPYVLARR